MSKHQYIELFLICPWCKGAGKQDGKLCWFCKGNGKVSLDPLSEDYKIALEKEIAILLKKVRKAQREESKCMNKYEIYVKELDFIINKRSQHGHK